MNGQLDEADLRRIRSQLIQRVREEGDDVRPMFYAVSGSYLHGVADSSSDVDVRGFHCADGTRYMLFDTPKSQIRFSMETPQTNTEVEVVSHELRQFGIRLSKYHFNAVEPLFGVDVIVNEHPDAISQIQSIVLDALPGELPNRYRGMAQSLYHQYVAPDAPNREEVTLKHLLYCVRGALAARYVLENGSVEPNLSRLSALFLDENEQSTVDQLVQLKRSPDSGIDELEGNEAVEHLISRLIADDLFTSTSHGDRKEFQDEIAAWMLRLREETHTD